VTAEFAPAEVPQRRSIPWGEVGHRRCAPRDRHRRPAGCLHQAASTSASGVGAGFVPKVVGVLLIALSLALMVQVGEGQPREPDEAEGDVDVRRTRWVGPLARVRGRGLWSSSSASRPLGYVIVSSIVSGSPHGRSAPGTSYTRP